MNTVTVRDVVIGEGTPKICVPVMGNDISSICIQANSVTSMPVDIVEWRADYLKGIEDDSMVESALRNLRDILGTIPILMTIRTASEGGEASIDSEKYAEINLHAAGSGLVDMVDIEAFSCKTPEPLIDKLHSAGVRVIASYHDFSGTPEKSEIVDRLDTMQKLGADIVKIAVMPHRIQDVTALLSAVDEMHTSHAVCPVVGISMSDIGIVSRLTGELFGSAITFGSGTESSAPGQIPAAELAELLSVIHRRF